MQRPNIVFFLLDDLGWRDLSCYGSTFYETPRLDRLAEQGMKFTDAYASCPVCSPTRASIVTGKYPATVGITNFIPGNAWGRLMGVPYLKELPKSQTTVARVLREGDGKGGYRTLHVGKWHLGPEGHWPQDFGFDENIGGCDWGMPKKGYLAPWQMPNMPEGEEGEYLTDRLTTHAIRLIRESKESGKPFFLNFCHYAVHTPIQAPAELVAKYEAKAKRLGLDAQTTFEEGENFSALHKREERVKRRLLQSDPTYAAMIENLDTNIGRVLDALAELDIAENTLVIFTSDNGGLATAEGSPTCNAPLAEGKGWQYEGGVREPLIVRWPGVVEPGTTCDVPVTSTDFYPTLLDAAGLDPRPDQHVDGVSLMPLLRGEDRLDREAIFWHYPHYSNQGGSPACSVRAGRWKLIEFFEDGRLELYDLVEDVGEKHDRSRDEPRVTRELHRRLRAWRESVEARIPQPNPLYEQMLRGDVPRPDGAGRLPAQWAQRVEELSESKPARTP